MFNRISPLMNTADPPGGGGSSPGQPTVHVHLPPVQGEDYRQMTPDQFKARLQEAGASSSKELLKALGVTKEQRAQTLARIEAGELMIAPKPKAGEPDYRSEYEKLKGVATEAEQLKAKVAKHGEFFKRVADEEFAKLPEAVQKDLVRRKIDDPELRLAEISGMRESGLIPAVVGNAAPVPVVAAPAVAVKPANTIAPPGPTPPGPAATLTLKQQYVQLRKASPMAAATFFKVHRAAIEADQS